MIDARIFLQLFTLEPSDLRIGFQNGGVLRQGPVNDKLVAVRRRKKLLLYEFHAEQGKRKSRDRHGDGGPPMMHANGKYTREHLCEASLSLVMTLHGGRQDRYSEQGSKQHRNDPRHD